VAWEEEKVGDKKKKKKKVFFFSFLFFFVSLSSSVSRAFSLSLRFSLSASLSPLLSLRFSLSASFTRSLSFKLKSDECFLFLFWNDKLNRKEENGKQKKTRKKISSLSLFLLSSPLFFSFRSKTKKKKVYSEVPSHELNTS